jgi:hypothetical protein
MGKLFHAILIACNVEGTYEIWDYMGLISMDRQFTPSETVRVELTGHVLGSVDVGRQLDCVYKYSDSYFAEHN